MINRQKVDKKIHLLQNNVSGIRSIIIRQNKFITNDQKDILWNESQLLKKKINFYKGVRMKDKLRHIQMLISDINNNILKNVTYKIQFTNKKIQDYCIQYIRNDKVLYEESFVGYDGVISGLKILQEMFILGEQEK